jgi:hypothetical protein
MPDAKALSKDHYLDVNDGKFAGTTRDDIHQLFAMLGGDPPAKLVLHFHGGNVIQGRRHAGRAKHPAHILQAGAYPIFFVWNSAILRIIESCARQLSASAGAKRTRHFQLERISESFPRATTRPAIPRLVSRCYAMATSSAGSSKGCDGRSHGIRSTIVEELLRAFFVTDFG